MTKINFRSRCEMIAPVPSSSVTVLPITAELRACSSTRLDHCPRLRRKRRADRGQGYDRATLTGLRSKPKPLRDSGATPTSTRHDAYAPTNRRASVWHYQALDGLDSHSHEDHTACQYRPELTCTRLQLEASDVHPRYRRYVGSDEGLRGLCTCDMPSCEQTASKR